MDIKLHFQEKGIGVPFIFLHGNSSNCSYFINQMENQDTFGDVHGVLSQIQIPPPASRSPLLLVLVPFRVIEQV